MGGLRESAVPVVSVYLVLSFRVHTFGDHSKYTPSDECKRVQKCARMYVFQKCVSFLTHVYARITRLLFSNPAHCVFWTRTSWVCAELKQTSHEILSFRFPTHWLYLHPEHLQTAGTTPSFRGQTSFSFETSKLQDCRIFLW